MGRKRAFSQEEALQTSIRLFCDRGYAATSTEQLCSELGIGKQSLYNAFGDKEGLFLMALESYVAASAHVLSTALATPGPALAGIRLALLAFAERAARQGTAGCMAINAINEFGERNAGLNALLAQLRDAQRGAVMAALQRAIASGEMAPDTNLEVAADFFDCTLTGIKMAAKAGMQLPELSAMATFASQAFIAPNYAPPGRPQ